MVRRRVSLQLAGGLHLVASGAGGLGLTDPFDCHVYLLDGGDEAVLVDAGIGRDAGALLANVEAAGVTLESLRYVFLTPAHPDHSGGAAALRDRLPRVEVVASPHVADVVRRGDEEAMSMANGKRAGFYPDPYRFPPCEVTVEVREGDSVRVGGIEVEAVETPGHADGHLTYLVTLGETTAAFTGDLVFYGGLISLAANPDCRLDAYGQSVAKLAGRDFDLFLPGHHEISLSDGRRHVEAAARRFAAGFVPPSIV
jgi:glyoxylase-like metal-dependent hydrolase (beta-lactamase superfamily II)